MKLGAREIAAIAVSGLGLLLGVGGQFLAWVSTPGMQFGLWHVEITFLGSGTWFDSVFDGQDGILLLRILPFLFLAGLGLTVLGLIVTLLRPRPGSIINLLAGATLAGVLGAWAFTVDQSSNGEAYEWSLGLWITLAACIFVMSGAGISGSRRAVPASERATAIRTPNPGMKIRATAASKPIVQSATIRGACPKCRNIFEARRGMTNKCPNCGTTISVP